MLKAQINESFENGFGSQTDQLWWVAAKHRWFVFKQENQAYSCISMRGSDHLSEMDMLYMWTLLLHYVI